MRLLVIVTVILIPVLAQGAPLEMDVIGPDGDWGKAHVFDNPSAYSGHRFTMARPAERDTRRPPVAPIGLSRRAYAR